MASRLSSCSWRLRRARQSFLAGASSAREGLLGTREFSSNPGDKGWRNETPVGSNTEVKGGEGTFMTFSELSKFLLTTEARAYSEAVTEVKTKP